MRGRDSTNVPSSGLVWSEQPSTFIALRFFAGLFHDGGKSSRFAISAASKQKRGSNAIKHRPVELTWFKRLKDGAVLSSADWRSNLSSTSCLWRQISTLLTVLHSYQARTHWQVAVTTRVFDAWVQYVGMRRWDEILYLRAAKHRAHVVRKHVLSNWRHNAVVCRTSRAQTVTALAHWKLSMQRKAFHGWLLRVRARQAKRYHLHEALEWRHAHFLQVGLVHWAQAAFALREQRLLQVQTHAATVAARLWRRVARISAHWRYVAKHRIIQGGRQNKAVAFHPLPTKARRAEEVIQPLGMASVAVATTIHHRLPPRKPLELLYDGDFVPSTTTRPKESTAAAMHVGIEKYGMSMPMSQAPRRLHASAESEGDDIERVVRDMESRMLYWQERRQSWKAHKKHLDALRKHLATSAGDSSYDMMRRTLEVMEETHLEHVAALASSKAEMASFARQIDQLHRRRGDAVIPN
ncbi:hypothetical protein, variant [Aphanomyces invadans]|uniref:Sfi1 spindle body domain-containing protein n=1 Tax=Aphanomyces invadans TaxID=157072 RepID=A0A024UN23_9STRA|nr:hypothetical protein, variant [Aphanomyces invadans]ETW07841.1 hypothetical protein, variant [Aphanomyces invadans]|eukprot:XP_008863934.1 hypothetical protein, variant [Aphanomyces invadans]